MDKSVSQKIIEEHLVKGRFETDEEVALKIDQTLTQDATGTLAYIEFEALGIPRIKTDLSVSYVDHNLLQNDSRNMDDHIFLQSVAKKFGLYFSKPGNGVSHHIHLERFSEPGRTLLGSDSHTPTAGGCGMLAMGSGGLDVAMAMAGYPFYITIPKTFGVRLTGKLRPWVSAKDVIFEILRRHSVKGGIGRIIEYFGPGVENLEVPERAAIANMGAELGATTTIFPSDENTKRFLEAQGRAEIWKEIKPDNGTEYDGEIELNLSDLEPLLARPSSPDNVKKVSELEGIKVEQIIIGSCGNSSYKDLMLVAKCLEKNKIHENVSLEINPGSRQILENIAHANGLSQLIHSGARIQQLGCLGCIGMGQSPATGIVSLRTFPRNFPGRSGTKNDKVYLCSPEVAIASAIKGEITDPRKMDEFPKIREPNKYIINNEMMIPPLKNTSDIKIIRGPNIKPFPVLGSLLNELDGKVLLKIGDNITTDHILPAGSKILPLRSNIPAISEFTFSNIDSTFSKKAKEAKIGFIVGGENYGQGSSREHAALVCRYLGIRAKIVKSFARIHRSNLINFGVMPLVLKDSKNYDKINSGDHIRIKEIRDQISNEDKSIVIEVNNEKITCLNEFSKRERKLLLSGGLINFIKTSPN
ncbi:MAG: aconitate hydratase [Candidatus Bathyarchaeota archaeon]|nr:aconitate hydratase [Candidatus Bathyarchaeota archaeon]MCZ2844946.1 aconitate hydratase [Candidatus Bathyarchaeota archaeon]